MASVINGLPVSMLVNKPTTTPIPMAFTALSASGMNFGLCSFQIFLKKLKILDEMLTILPQIDEEPPLFGEGLCVSNVLLGGGLTAAGVVMLNFLILDLFVISTLNQIYKKRFNPIEENNLKYLMH
ncbi:hypothetical protein [Endozoicomonas elysicola]|uniref:Uncharacterized protein n=1 Tax=Endozoicomonas elysicola TaxID=305900 RepID=A0A081K8K1_9GAMM|nr:hypothetical protein [Endozoicomonas elysicola]KEI70477.1 hypothetical protein GV64_06780 [Endozoicomonas elysicola]